MGETNATRGDAWERGTDSPSPRRSGWRRRGRRLRDARDETKEQNEEEEEEEEEEGTGAMVKESTRVVDGGKSERAFAPKVSEVFHHTFAETARRRRVGASPRREG